MTPNEINPEIMQENTSPAPVEAKVDNSTTNEKKNDCEPTIEVGTGTMMCMMILPTDVKNAIITEMERRAVDNDRLRAAMIDVQFTEVFDRIEKRLVTMAQENRKELSHSVGGVQCVGLHFSDKDTYDLAEWLILNQLTEREKAEKEKAKAQAKKKEEKNKDKVVPLTPKKETKKEEETPKATQLSLF